MALKDCTFNNTVSINDLITKGIYQAKVLKVYDGDTVWIAYYNLSIGLIKAKVRLNRIDAPEIRGTKNETKSEKQARSESANRSKDEVIRLIDGKIVTLHITGIDKYSRILGDILIESWDDELFNKCGSTIDNKKYIDLSNYLLLGGFAKEY